MCAESIPCAGNAGGALTSAGTIFDTTEMITINNARIVKTAPIPRPSSCKLCIKSASIPIVFQPAGKDGELYYKTA